MSTDTRHNEWISTEAAPGSAPNTGFFFCPAWYLMGHAPGTMADVYQMVVVTELLIQCRGYKNPR